MDRKTRCILTCTSSAPCYKSKLWKNTLYMIKIVRVHCWVQISNTCSFIIIWNNVRGRKIEIEWRERSHTHGLTREKTRQYHRLSIKSFCRNNKALDTRLFWAKLRFSSPKRILFTVGGHGRSWNIAVFVDYIGGNRVRSGQPFLPDYRCIRKSQLCFFLNRS